MSDGTPGVPLEPTSGSRAELGDAVLAFLNRFIDERDIAPASSPETNSELLADLAAPPPELGDEMALLLKKLDRSLDTGFDTASGRFLSYIPSGGLYTAALGSLLGSGVNRYTGGAHAAPGMVAIEQSVIDWMISLFGLPDSAGGLLLSGGSIANLTAVVTARNQLGDRFDDGVIYASERAHHSIEKAARIAGIASSRMRFIPTDDRLRIDPVALERAVMDDRRGGLRPMMVVATAGTTDTGSIDPISRCAAVARESAAWFHVDAAYGGFFQLTDRGRRRFAGIDRADSVTVDAHKSLFLPFGIGGLLVRDAAKLIDAHEGHGAYMRDVLETDLPHYLSMGPELTRPNRGLPVWLALHLHGIAQFRETLDRMLDLAVDSATGLAAIPGIRLASEPELSIVAFRALEGDVATQRVFEALNASREVHVSSTTIEDRMHIRLAFLSQRTTPAIAKRAVELVSEAMAQRTG